MTKLIFRMPLALCVMLAACSSREPYDPTVYGVNGALIGGAAGAGVGAAVGAAIPNGIVLDSALLGGAIGAPIGLAAGIGYAQYKRTEEIRALRNQSEENKLTLAEQSSEIEALRQSLSEEPAPLEPNEAVKARMYQGVTLGK